jgi:hypothetical protein
LVDLAPEQVRALDEAMRRIIDLIGADGIDDIPVASNGELKLGGDAQPSQFQRLK